MSEGGNERAVLRSCRRLFWAQGKAVKLQASPASSHDDVKENAACPDRLELQLRRELRLAFGVA